MWQEWGSTLGSWIQTYPYAFGVFCLFGPLATLFGVLLIHTWRSFVQHRTESEKIFAELRHGLEEARRQREMAERRISTLLAGIQVRHTWAGVYEQSHDVESLIQHNEAMLSLIHQLSNPGGEERQLNNRETPDDG